jgi:hypothetical protein
MRRLFTDHPAAVGESYGQHFCVASYYAFWLFCAAGCALVHACLPFLFTRTASTIVQILHADLIRRGATSASPVGRQPAMAIESN